MANLTTTMLGSIEELRAIEPEWRAMTDDLSAGPFSLPSLVLPWWEHLGKGAPSVVVVRDDGHRLLGLALLHQRRLGAVDVVRWMGHGLGAIGEVLVRPSASDVAGDVWQHLAGSKRRVLQLVEYRHDPNGSGTGGLDALRRSPAWAVHPVLRDACPVIDLRGHASVESFLGEPGRRKLRQNMARQDRLVEREAGQLSVDVHTDEATVMGALDDLTLVHDAAEAAKPRLHFLAGQYRDFTVDVLRRTAAEGRVAVFIVRIDGRPVGLHVVVTSGSVAYAWLARFDPAAAAYAPGHLMLREVVRWAIGKGLTTVDLQLGDDAYKLRWSSSTYDTIGVLAAVPSRLPAARAYLAGVEGAFRFRGLARDKAAARRG